MDSFYIVQVGQYYIHMMENKLIGVFEKKNKIFDDSLK